MIRRRRQSLVGLAIGLLIVSTGIVATNVSGAPGARPAAPDFGEEPPLLGSRLQAMRQPVPGDGGMAPDGPGSAELDEFLARAYPANAITVAQTDAAKAAFARSQTRVLSAAARVRRPGGWTRLGPTEALYPFSPLRTSRGYLPNEYTAGGRTTGVALSHVCVTGNCRAWITPAGGGVWRTNDILAARPVWRYLGGPLGINSAGAVTVDRNDRRGNTVYVGTGEANVCSQCAGGVGLYKSTNGGNTWIGPLGKAELGGKGIGAIVVKPGDPKTLYVGTTVALASVSSVCCEGVTRIPDAAKWGLYKSTDGGATWRFLHNGSSDPAACTGGTDEAGNRAVCSPRGVRHLKLDPVDPEIVYAGSYARGIWRSPDGGATWTQIKPSLDPANFVTRPAFDVARLPNGKTRMYVYEGNTGTPSSRLFRSDDVTADVPVFTDLTSANVADPGFAWHNLCNTQCWYDVFVHTPEGHPDMVYVGGSYSYREHIANKRAVVLSTDAGRSGTDMTMDGTDPLHPGGLHPDQHAMATNPHNPLQFFVANDAGVARSSGVLVDVSGWCDTTDRGLDQAQLARCQQMLSAVPSRLEDVNAGVSTLQFQSLSVSPHDHRLLQGGTQDNGTWQNSGGGASNARWLNTMIGDGGQSGFDAGNPDFRFHNFFRANPEVNFNGGSLADWIYIGDPLIGHAGTLFYVPHISDPRVSGTMFIGTGRTAYRTTTLGLGDRSLAESQRICNSWNGTAEAQCGDWAELGPNRLTDPFWGNREAGAVAAIERTRADTTTAWVATTRGRVFVTSNVDAPDPASVSFTRIDDDAVTPNRFVSSIHVDPTDGNHAWISYNGFDRNTPATPGHVFEVRYDPAAGTSTWTNHSYDLGDMPVTDLVRDDAFGDLYASTDFGVLRLAVGTTNWSAAAPGMPHVQVAGLTVVPNKRVLYAATHGLGAWRLKLR